MKVCLLWLRMTRAETSWHCPIRKNVPMQWSRQELESKWKLRMQCPDIHITHSSEGLHHRVNGTYLPFATSAGYCSVYSRAYRALRTYAIVHFLKPCFFKILFGSFQLFTRSVCLISLCLWSDLYHICIVDLGMHSNLDNFWVQIAKLQCESWVK